MNLDLLLIYPPVSKPAEPPAGVACLKGAMLANGLSCDVIDANRAGLHYLLDHVPPGKTPRLESAYRNRQKNVQTLRSVQGLLKFDHYKRSVLESNRLLAYAGHPFGATLNFTDFKQNDLLPVRSTDLIRASQHPERNPFYDYFTSELLPHIEKLAPGAIGLSLIYLSQAVTTFALIGLIRQRYPEINILLGGGLVTSWTSQPNWNNPFSTLVDEIFSGRAEDQLLNYFDVSSQRSHHVTPNYENTHWEEYFSPVRILPYSASTGCYWRKCTFCPECAEGNAFSPIPHADVLDDLNNLNSHKPALIHFLDNALTPALLLKLIEQPPAAPWYGYVRFIRELEDMDFCMALRRSGCLMIKLGLESGNQQVLDDMSKGIDIQRVSLILKNLKRAGIATYVYILFGTPYEDVEQARDTVQFVLEHTDYIDYINPAIFNMPVYSDEAALHATRTFYDGDLTLYHDFEHPKGFSRGLVRQFLQKEFRSHNVIKKILLANPPSFTSNHAPLFTDHFLNHRG